VWRHARREARVRQFALGNLPAFARPPVFTSIENSNFVKFSILPKAAAVVAHSRSLVDLWLGEQLRQLRKRQRRPLAEVAAACGVSLGLLSQIERGLSSPSLKVLHALAGEYGVPLDTLLRNTGADDGDPAGYVVRAGRHRRIDNPDHGVHKEMYTPPRARALDLCRAVLAPGGSSGEGYFVTDSDEQVGLVLRGELELWIGPRVLRLKPGDSFCYAGSEPRRWRNPGSTETEVIWAIGHPASGQPANRSAPRASDRPSVSTNQQGD